MMNKPRTNNLMNQTKLATRESDRPADPARREAVLKLGKFAAYAAPFTLLVGKPTSAKAAGKSGSCPSTHHKH